jgi:hypothetical protein
MLVHFVVLGGSFSVAVSERALESNASLLFCVFRFIRFVTHLLAEG